MVAILTMSIRKLANAEIRPSVNVAIREVMIARAANAIPIT